MLLLAGKATYSLVAGILLASGFLPDRDQLPLISIPAAITRLHPLPQEELLRCYNAGNGYLTIGAFDLALEELNRCADRDLGSNVADVFLTRGIINEKLLRWDEAISDYQTAKGLYAKKFNPFGGNDDSIVYNNLANAETGKELWQDALRDFTTAASKKEDFVAPRLGKALVLFQLDRKDEAIAYFSALVAKYPLFADGLAALALMEFDRGNTAEAASLWERGLEQDSRYLDLEWVRDVRRFPPKLVEVLVKLKTSSSGISSGSVGSSSGVASSAAASSPR